MKNTHKNGLRWIPGLVVLLAIAALSIPSIYAAPAVDSSNDLTIQVNISEKTIIDIQPKSFSWGQGTQTVLPGSVAGPSKEVSGYGRIQIENLGSVNISKVWFNTTSPSQRPFGTGNPNLYDSGNFISIDSNNTNTDINQFVARKEYGLDQPSDDDIIYLATQDGWDYGRFRVASKEYFWTADDTGASTDGATFRIGIDHHNSTQTGSTSLDTQCDYGDEAGSSNPNCNGYTLTNVSDSNGNWWAVTEVEVGAADTSPTSPDGGSHYCVAMDASTLAAGSGTDPEATFVKWDKGHPAVEAAGGTSDCAYATNYTVGDTSSDVIVPGDWKVMNIRAKIPYGTVAEQLPTGNLFVVASSQ